MWLPSTQKRQHTLVPHTEFTHVTSVIGEKLHKTEIGEYSGLHNSFTRGSHWTRLSKNAQHTVHGWMLKSTLEAMISA